MNEYLLNINSKGSEAVFKLFYKRGKFFRLEQISGKLLQNQHESLMKLVPQLEEVILILRAEFEGRVEWIYVQKKDTQNLFRTLSDEYTQWYSERFKIKPKFSGVEGNAMKSIIKHLEELVFGDHEQVISIWSTILNNWDDQSTFFRGQTELRQINSNLNTILRTIKHGKKATEKGTASDDPRNKL